MAKPSVPHSTNASVLSSSSIPPSSSRPRLQSPCRPASSTTPTSFPFRHCLGAIDGTHIPAVLALEGQKPFRNRKGFCSQNVLAAASFDMRFQAVYAGWEG